MTAVTERPGRAEATAGPTQRIAIGPDGRGPERTVAISPDELASWTHGELVARGTLPIAGGAVDSRLVRGGEAFFALPGEHTDGHRFLEAATAAGAGALVVTEALSSDRLRRSDRR